MRNLLVFLALCGCGSVNPVTLYQLSQVDPLTTDPAQIALKLSLPEGLGLMPGTATLMLGAEREGERFEERMVLKESGDVWQVADVDTGRLRAAQARIAAWKAEGQATGHLAFDLAPCRIGKGPADDATATVAIRLELNGAFLPLVNDGPISAVAGDTDLRHLAPCPRASLLD